MLILLLGFITCAIGALPPGLVNLSVVQVALNSNSKKALFISIGASIIEIMFATTTVIGDKLLGNFIDSNHWVQFIIIIILVLSALYFLLFKNGNSNRTFKEKKLNGFLLGIFLNLISIQVFIFWIVAIAYLHTLNINFSEFTQVFMFLAGVFIAKMCVLKFYIYIGKKYLKNKNRIVNKFDKIIGGLLLVISLYQILKFN